MAGWYASQRLHRSTKAVLVLAALAVAFVAAVPVALVAGLILMVFGHVVGGLALFGASILAAGAAVLIAGVSGMHRLRKLVTEQRFRIVQLGRGDYSSF
jgi:uncharacterized membrane protein YdjX (TVP38/TMEM64 family)